MAVRRRATQPRTEKHFQPLRGVRQTACCVVGGGPAGMMLTLLLARQGVPVMLLEAHTDFDRDFRGNTISPPVMEVLDDLGLAERVLRLRHVKIRNFTLQTGSGPLVFADFSRLKTRYPYITMLPQVHFLECLAAEVRHYPHAQIVMGAQAQALIEEQGIVRGVCYQGRDGQHEVRALLTVGADGRFSRLRRLAGLQPIASAPPMDVFWFRLPRRPDDPDAAGALFRFGPQSLLVLMDHFEYWDVGYIIAKGSYPELRAAGLPALRRTIAEIAPEVADRLHDLKSWRQGALLSVESNHLARWFKPGLLLIGDAAHVMSPVGGIGINYAIQDAVVAARWLGPALKAGRLDLDTLRAVQRRRAWPTRVIQAIQALAHRRIVAQALSSSAPLRLPGLLRLALRLPIVSRGIGRLIAFGAWPVRKL
ncbi:MAG TPA: FAD-dependent oxidoreductase [Herpetosiphonaceae bacterium]